MSTGPSRSGRTILVNRAPVLTLWAAVVAERLGYEHDTALTLGRSVAGRIAAAKAIGLGIAEPRSESTRRKAAPRGKDAGRAKAERPVQVTLLGRSFRAVETEEGLRALDGGKPVSPASVERYLESKFGSDLGEVRKAMTALARSRTPQRLAAEAFSLYET